MTNAATTQACWRIFCSLISLAGVFLLVLLLISLVDGSLGRNLFPLAPDSWIWKAVALILSLPVPFHVFAIGLILQRRHLSPAWRRFAWVSIVVSGLWLGAALLAKAVLCS